MAVLRSTHANGRAFPGCNPYCCTAYLLFIFGFLGFVVGFRVMDKSNLPDVLDWLVNDNDNIAVRPYSDQSAIGGNLNPYFTFHY
jgi:hypothetical protein